MSNEGDWIFDPFLGTGTTIVAAIRYNRRGVGAEVEQKYVDIAINRIEKELQGVLKTRPMNRPVYDPVKAGNSLTVAPWTYPNIPEQPLLIKERKRKYSTL